MALESFRSRAIPVSDGRAEPARGVAEGEKQKGRGHGMSRNREPKDGKGLPHDPERDHNQPYAHEIDDYTTGIAAPPDDSTGPPGQR